MTTITKKILLAPGGFYDFKVKAPQVLSIHAFDENITLQPGDELHMIIAAPPHPQPKSVALPVPAEERKIA
jgi:hypothetical protein